jgi:hypothetical protein
MLFRASSYIALYKLHKKTMFKASHNYVHSMTITCTNFQVQYMYYHIHKHPREMHQREPDNTSSSPGVLYVDFKIMHPSYLCSTDNTSYTISKGKEIHFKAKTLAQTCWKRGQWILYSLQSWHKQICCCWHPRHLTEQSNRKIVHLQITWVILEQRDKILCRVTYQKANQPKVQLMHVEIKIWKTKEKNKDNFTRDPISWCKLSSRYSQYR